MRLVLKIASFLFHPLWMSFLGSLIYFLISPRFFPSTVIRAKLTAIAIMTIFIPIIFYFLLRTLGVVQTYFLKTSKERKWPLLFSIVLHGITIWFVLDRFDYPALFYYFVGLLLSAVLSLLLVGLKVKASLHMMGLAALASFLILLSTYFGIILVYTISFFLAITGLTASSRLHFKAHSFFELLLGILVGLLPQFLLFPLWSS